MQRIIYLILSTILVFTSCHKKREPESYWPDVTPQTTLMYMTGVDLLNKGYYTTNIVAAQRAIAAGALNYGRFLVFTHDRNKLTSATLTEYKYSKGKCVGKVLKKYDNITSLSQEAMVEVINDVKSFAPAAKYNLIMSGHGTGWVPQTKLADYWRVAPASGVEPFSVDWGAMQSSPIVTRYMGCSSDSYFDIEDLDNSLTLSDTHFGYIIFDACFMSSIEVLYDLREHSDYIVASPCEIMGAGFPYNSVLPYLFRDSGYSFDLEGVCRAYRDYYSNFEFKSGCVAVAVTSELEQLASITRDINALGDLNEVDITTLQPYERLKDHIFVDFEQYMLAKCSDYILASEFTKQMAMTFPLQYRFHTDRFFAKIGESASSLNKYDEYYTTVDYYSGVTTSATSTQVATEWQRTNWAQAVEAF